MNNSRTRRHSAVAVAIAVVVGLNAYAEPTATTDQTSSRSRSVPGGIAAPRSAITVDRLTYPTTSGSFDPAQNWGDLYLPAHSRRAQSRLIVVIHGGG